MMRRMLCMLVMSCVLVRMAFAAENLEKNFLTPPDSAKPWVYWFFMNGNITREGITADLEAMQRVGLGGGVWLNLDFRIPTGLVQNVPYFSDEWRGLLGHAVSESDRLGLQMSTFSSDGWSGTGGPWITPDNAMQRLTWSETCVQGAGRRQVELARPATNIGFYRDVAVIAFPTPEGEGDKEQRPRLTTNVPGFNAALLADGDAAKRVNITRPKGGEISVQWEFSEPFAARSVTLEGLALSSQTAPRSAQLLASDNGSDYRPVCRIGFAWRGRFGSVTAAFRGTRARFFRLLFGKADFPDDHLQVSEVSLRGAGRINAWEGKAGFVSISGHGGGPGGPAFYEERMAAGLAPVSRGSVAGSDEAPAIPSDGVIDLSQSMDASGRLEWDMPEGRWTILRVGYTPTGAGARPATEAGKGLECDKLSPRGVEAAFQAVMVKLLKQMGPLAGKTFTEAFIDSWEMGDQNWTAAFREEFKQRRGYDMTTWLPVMAGGRIVGSRDQSERFLWDLRRTIADLMAENFWGRMNQLCHEHGIRLQAEPGGLQQYMYDPIVYQKQVDVPMGEYWTGGPRVDCRTAASAGHLYGKPVIGVEIFTSGQGNWRDDPYSLKALGDHAFCLGMNQYLIHRYTHQPWQNLSPGMTFAKYGINFERTNTWWEQSADWIAYITRCQYLLRQGSFVADVVSLIGEGAPSYLGWSDQLSVPVPSGYDYDGCDAEAVIRLLSVENGRLVTPSGMSYRMLLLPDRDVMTPALARRVCDLVRDGATVVGPRPARSPSLSGYPKCDEEVRELAKEVWGDCDGQRVKEHAFGKGRVVWGKSFGDMASGLGLTPDFEYLVDGKPVTLRYIHRRTVDADIYFVSNPEDRPVEARCAFRVTGKAPELWRADTGDRIMAAVFEETPQQTFLPIRFDPHGSTFVVFRREPVGAAVTAVRRDGQSVFASTENTTPEQRMIELERTADGHLMATIAENGRYVLEMVDGKSVELSVATIPAPMSIGGAWELRFPEGRGAPDRITLDSLGSWTGDSRPGVKYFSGTAIYTKGIDIPAALLGEGKRLALDLGAVKNLAEVSLNGRRLGVLWKPPFSVDISAVAKPGVNRLEVHVTNLWANRLIGDEQAPAESSWKGEGAIAEWPTWVAGDGPRPTNAGRYAFTTWKHYAKDSALLESGLLGPVRLVSARREEVK